MAVLSALYFTLPPEEPNAERSKGSAGKEQFGTAADLLRAAAFAAVMVCLSLTLPWIVAPVMLASLALVVIFVRIQRRHSPRQALAFYAAAVFGPRRGRRRS